MNIQQLIDQRVRAAFNALDIPKEAATLVVQAGKPQFGDYQANGVMGAAKRMKTNPRELAAKVLEQLQLDDLAEKVEIAGPGFINIFLKDQWLGERLGDAMRGERLDIAESAEAQKVVVDYSGPNLAKEMHVGHLRSSIIGDAVVRVLSFLGHDVVRQNHVGDWGTQFGMLIAYMVEKQQDGGDISMELSDLERFYREAKLRFDDDADFAGRARDYVVKLQGGDLDCRKLWQQFIDESLRHCDDVYQRLGVSLTREHVRPESAYNDDLPKVIAELNEKGLLSESEGAQCVFLDEFKGRDDEPLPCIVQKSDGGFLYATTDLAAVRYRGTELKADRLLYFVDARQSLHFKQIFAISRAAGFAAEQTELRHCEFGTMLGEDGKPFKTRSGGTVKLVDLLKEAEVRAFDLVSEKNPDMAEEERREIAKMVGIGAVKYADLSKNRSSDYVFSWDNMLSFEGNTAPYMQYAYARSCSIFRNSDVEVPDAAAVLLEHAAERTLAVKLLRFEEALAGVAKDCTPNTLCTYLYDVAGAFMSFYEACPVNKAEGETRAARLRLCHLTAATIRQGLDLLGIASRDKM